MIDFNDNHRFEDVTQLQDLVQSMMELNCGCCCVLSRNLSSVRLQSSSIEIHGIKNQYVQTNVGGIYRSNLYICLYTYIFYMYCNSIYWYCHYCI